MVSMVVDGDGQPVAVCLDWADVVRDGIVWDFFGAVTIVRRHLDTLEQQLGCRFTHAATSFPPGTDPRISINVLESAGLEVSHVLDEPTAVADLLQLDNAGVVDIGGGTTGIAIVKQGKVTYSADEATGGHHISLTLAGNRRIQLEEAEQYKRSNGQEIWPVVKPVYEKWRKSWLTILPGRASPIYGWPAVPACSRAWMSCSVSASRNCRCIYLSTACL